MAKKKNNIIWVIIVTILLLGSFGHVVMLFLNYSAIRLANLLVFIFIAIIINSKKKIGLALLDIALILAMFISYIRHTPEILFFQIIFFILTLFAWSEKE